MTKEDLIRKLTSRKFWIALVSIVTGIILLCGGAEDTTQEVSGLLMTIGGTVAYIFGEAWADSNNKN